MDSKSLKKSVQTVQAVALGLAYGAEDLEQAADGAGRPIIYNFDFGFLAPQLFGAGAREARHSDTRLRVRKILKLAPTNDGVCIAVSGPTLLEFEDRLGHQLHAVQNSVRTAVSRLASGGRGFLDEAVASTDAIHEDLVRLLDMVTSAGLQQFETQVQRFLDLLAAGALVGLDDVVDLDELALPEVSELDALLSQHWAARRSADQSRRTPEESEFHYKMDAANVLLTQESVRARTSPILFVTPTQTSVRQCEIDDTQYARPELAPLVVMNADRLVLEGTSDERGVIRRMKRLARNGLELADEVEQAGGTPNMSDADLFEHMTYLDNASPFIDTEIGQTVRERRGGPHERLEEMRELMNDGSALDDAIEDGSERIRAQAQVIDSMYERSYARYLEHWGFDDDPIVRKMRAELRLR